jgi:hypothetical protein
MGLQPFFEPWPLFQFLNTVDRTSFMGDQRVARPLPTRRATQASVLRLGFEPTTAVFERAMTLRVLDRAVTVIGAFLYKQQKEGTEHLDPLSCKYLPTKTQRVWNAEVKAILLMKRVPEGFRKYSY